MDDVLLVTSRSREWDDKEFLQDFQECYLKPLKLEKAPEGVFLETAYDTDGISRIECKIKNDNEEERKIWRYHHYDSALPYEMKRATMMATLRKVHKMASNNKMLTDSAIAKLNEFRDLGYPQGIRKFMCAILARDNHSTYWRYVRSIQC